MMRAVRYVTSILLFVSSATVSAGVPLIDGIVNSEEWAGAELVTLRYEISPGLNIPARESTEVRHKVAEGNLYVAFVASDTAPQAIRARKRERDSVFDEDSVGIVIAPAGVRGTEAYSFYVSAGGTQFDARWNESNNSEDNRWDARWWSATKVTGNGYSVEMRIPLASLPLPAGKEQHWAVDFMRILPRDFRYQLASLPRDRNRGCYVCQLQPVQLTIDQTINWRAIEARIDVLYQDDAYNGSDSAPTSSNLHNFGIDVTWRPLHSLTAALTINPDFSQVEADVLRPVTNAADAFFFDERRPFFVETGQSFSQLLPLFYPRNIADPSMAFIARYRNQGGNTALLYAQDVVTQLIEPGVEGSGLVEYRRADGSSLPGQVLALRTQQSVATSTIGATITSRQADSYNNNVVAMDARVPLTRSTMLNAALAISDTSSPQTAKADGTGNAIYAQISRNTLEWTSQFSYERYSDAFRADLGSLFRVDVQRAQGAVRRTFHFDTSNVISETSVQLDGWQRHEIGGELVDRRSQLSFSVAGTGQARGTLWLIDGETRFRQRYWTRDGWEFALDTTPSDAWRASLGLLWIDDVDRLGLRPAELRQIRTSLIWSPSDTIRWQYQSTFRRLLADEGELFDEQFHDVRGYYFFNNSLYLRGTLRAWSLERQPRRFPSMALLDGERSRDWQLLMVWRPSIGTSLYAGVTKGRDVDDLAAADPISFQRRTWFVKASVSFDGNGIFR